MDLGNDTCIFKPLTLHPKPRFRAEVEPVEIGVHDFAGLRAVRGLARHRALMINSFKLLYLLDIWLPGTEPKWREKPR